MKFYIIKNYKIKSLNKKKGFVTLISVLIMGAIAISITLSLLLLGLSSSRTSFALQIGIKAKYLANACAEEALQQIRDNPTFIGFDSISINGEKCFFEVKNLGGENRSIASYSKIGTIIKKIQVIIDKINPQINIVSWQEVADF